MSTITARKYSDNPNNIGNLPEGAIDTILTSPPYSEQLQAKTDYEKRKERLLKVGHTKATHGLLRGQKSTSKVIGGDERYSDKRENIGNLVHGNVDAIVTSPPYGDSLSQDHEERKETKVVLRKSGRNKGKPIALGKSQVHTTYSELDPTIQRLREHGRTDTKQGGPYGRSLAHPYSKRQENIGNLPHGKVDTIITSPPYAEAKKHDKRGRSPQAINKMADKLSVKSGDHHTPGRLDRIKGDFEGYSDSEENIGNLRLGEVDAVITSPPYADIHQCPTSTGWTEFFRRQLEEKGYIEWNGKRYTEAEWRAMNHGRLDGRSTRGMKKDAKYSENPENIGNLPHEGSVDTIITSPPYEATFNVKQHTLSGIAKRDPDYRREVGGYGQSEENIGNLRRGKGGVDAILTSPPYGHDSVVHKNRCGETKVAKEKFGYADFYSKSNENIGNLKHKEVDAVLTSPPYQHALHDTLEKRQKWREKEMHQDKKGLPVGYSENEENIGNIKEQETYLEAMLKCYAEMLKVLKHGGYCIVVLKNFIRNFKVVDLIGDTVKLCEFVGFKLEKKIMFRLPTKSFWRILYQKKWEKKFNQPFPEEEFASVYDFETCLVFKKQ